MFGVTFFGLVLHICMVNAMIFIQKNGNRVQDQFLKISKDPKDDNFGYIDKIMPFFSSSSLIKNNLSDKKNPKI